MPRKKRINKLFTLDTETIGLGGDIKRIAVYDGQEVTYGYTFDDVEWVFEKSYKEGFTPHVYIHNLEFDIRKMPKIFEKGNVNWNNTILINNKYARIHCRRYILHDSFKLLPMSLSSLSKSFGLEHGKLDLWDEVQKVYPEQYTNHVDFLNRCDKDDPVYLKYLGFDVISLYELMEKLMDVSGLSLDEMVNRVSTASLSKYIFKNGYKGQKFIHEGQRKTDYEIMTQYTAWSSPKPFKQCPKYSYLDIENKIRAGYYGGRTEVFTPRLKESKAFHYDVNSLYPSQMIDNVYPVGEPRYYEDPDLVRLTWTSWLKDHIGLGFLKCVVHIPQQHIPPLPAKMGKLVFPTGVVPGTWTFIELEYAVKNCGVEVLEYQEVIYFSQVFPIFHNFINTFYKMKEEGKKQGRVAETQLAKLLMNTSYGWSILRRDDKTELKDIDKKEKYLDRLNYENEEYGFINIKSIVVSDSIQAQVGAYVTSYARLVLLDALRKQDAAGTVYYCDTDSIVCSAPLPKAMVHSTALGKWDLEGVLTDGIFLFPKVYTEIKDSKNTIRFKGISKDTQAGLSFDFYENLLGKLQRGEKDEIIVQRGKELLRGMLYTQKKGIDPNTLMISDKKVNLSNIQKRNMDYAANSSMPWYFETLEEFNGFSFAAPIKDWDTYGNIFDPLS